MDLQKLYSYSRRAISDYDMIDDGDVIAIGISGGKDSLTLLYALSGLQRFYPKKFEVKAITVDLGFGIQDLDRIDSLCQSFGVEYYIVKTDISDIIFNYRKESNPCSLCSKMRKGALNEKAKELGCNKIAYAHHKDDLIETMFLSLLFEGRFYSFSPRLYLDRMNLTVIRPLIYVSESEIIGFQHKNHLPVAKGKCPADGTTKRQYAKELVKKLQEDHPGAKERIFRAIMDGNIPGWPERNHK